MNAEDAIRKRALRYFMTPEWRNPTVVSVSPADETLVRKLGSGILSDYRRLRIEVEMHPAEAKRILETLTDEDRNNAERFLQGLWTFDITCTSSDIIEVTSPYVDLD